MGTEATMANKAKHVQEPMRSVAHIRSYLNNLCREVWPEKGKLSRAVDTDTVG